MSNAPMKANHDALSEVLNDPLMIKLVTIVNLASLSILEILEYGFARKDVSRAMAKGIIEFDKSVAFEKTYGQDVVHVFESGDYYFESLSSKIRLSKLGQLVLEMIQGEETQAAITAGEMAQAHEDEDTTIHRSAPHV